MERDVVFKIFVCGEGGVGKTTLTKRFVTGLFDDRTKMTIGLEFHKKNLEVEGKNVALQIWDFAGEERFREILPTYVVGATGGIFMYDVTRFASLKRLSEWYYLIHKGLRATNTPQKIPLIMIGGKADLDHKRAVSREEAKDAAESLNFAGFGECSSKSGNNVENIFIALTRLMLEYGKFI